MRKHLLGLLVIAMLLLCMTIAAAYADTITLPVALSDLGEAAFQNDSSLDTVIVSDGVTEIKDLTFAGSSLREIHLPASMLTIAPTAFDNCSGVQFYVQNQYTKNWAEDHGFTATVEATQYAAMDSVEISSFTVTNYNASFVLTVGTTQATADSGYRLGVQFSRTEADINDMFRTEPTLRTIPMNNGNDRVTIDLAPGYEGFVRAVLVNGSGSVIATGSEILSIRMDSGLAGYVELEKDESFTWSGTADQHLYFVAPTAGVYTIAGTNMNEIRTFDKDSRNRGAGGDSGSYEFGTRLEAGEVLYIRASNSNALACSILVTEEKPIRTDSFTIEGTSYTASYFGYEDMSSWNDRYSSREFWRLENAYDDFSNHSQTGNWLPSSNYPMYIEAGQVYLVEYKLTCNGGTERMVMRCDGNYRNGMLNTHQIIVDAPLDTVYKEIGGKTYTVSYYGWRYSGSWHPYAVASEFWRLEGAYNDFLDCPTTGNYSAASNYPLPVENGQVYLINYTLKNGGTEHTVKRCDGDYNNGMLMTYEILVDNPLGTELMTIGGKTYTATYYGERDTSQWGQFGQSYITMKVWRLENAYEDFKNCELSNSNLTENCYIMPIEEGQVFVVDLTRSTGGIQHQLMRCDGDRVADGRLTTHSFIVP